MSMRLGPGGDVRGSKEELAHRVAEELNRIAKSYDVNGNDVITVNKIIYESESTRHPIHCALLCADEVQAGAAGLGRPVSQSRGAKIATG